MEIYLLPLLSYAIGSVSSAIIVCKLMRLPDPRTAGSNNPGATNVLRIGGKKAAIITLFGDVLKGVIPVLIARSFTVDATVIALCGMGAFLGHLFPVFFSFRGGKGVATALGVFIGLSIKVTACLAAIWLVVALMFRYSSLAALSACALAPAVVYYFLPGIPYLVLSVMVAVLLFVRHKANISRLISGTESKIKF